MSAASGQECRLALIDITERKLAEEELRKNERELAEAQRIAHLGNWQWDSISGTISGSDEVFRILGRVCSSVDEFLEVVHPDDREWVRETIRKTIDRPSPFDISYRIVTPDRTIRVAHAIGEAEIGDDGRQVRVFGTVQDITERRMLEEKLEILHSELARPRAELEAANIELEAFNYSVSHDLRRPLTVINGYCQVVKELCGDKLDEQCKGYIQEIYEGTLRMNRLIDTLLRFFARDPRRNAPGNDRSERNGAGLWPRNWN